MATPHLHKRQLKKCSRMPGGHHSDLCSIYAVGEKKHKKTSGGLQNTLFGATAGLYNFWVKIDA